MEKRFDMILGKQRARARLREFIGKHLHSRKNARVLCLPGEHGREIEHVYRKLGFRDENITGIEADLASVKGVQEHYPHITVHEGTVAEYAKQEAIRCIESEAKPRPFSVVSLDYCGVFSRDKLEFLSTMAALGHLSDNVVIAVNLFAGRESQVNQKEMREALACRLSFERKDPRISNVTQYLSTARGAELDDARDVCTALNVEDFVCHQAAGRRMCFHGPYSHCRHVKVDWLSPTMRQSMVWSIEHNGLDQAKLLLGDHLPVFAIDACMNELIEQLAEAAKVMGEVIASSPLRRPAARHARCSAAVPLQTATAYLAPVYAHSAASNSLTLGPCVRKSERMTAETAAMSSAPML